MFGWIKSATKVTQIMIHIEILEKVFVNKFLKAAGGFVANRLLSIDFFFLVGWLNKVSNKNNLNHDKSRNVGKSLSKSLKKKTNVGKEQVRASFNIMKNILPIESTWDIDQIKNYFQFIMNDFPLKLYSGIFWNRLNSFIKLYYALSIALDATETYYGSTVSAVDFVGLPFQ